MHLSAYVPYEILAAVAIGAVVGWLWVGRSLRNDVLTVNRRRSADAVDGLNETGQVTRKTGDEQPPNLNNILRFLELDPDACKTFPMSEVPLLSLPEYCASLELPGGFDWRRAVVTLLSKTGLSVFIPAARLVPRGAQEDGPVDPLIAIGGSHAAVTLFSAAFSPLQLYAMAEAANLAAAVSHSLQVENQCMESYLRGSERRDDSLTDLPSPFILDQHLPPLLAGLDPDGEPEAEVETAPVEWLPDLSMSSVGMRKTNNAHKIRSSSVIAILLNKLASNGVPPEWRPPGCEAKQTVRLTESGPCVCTPEDFLDQLMELPGASVRMNIATNVTSFGMGVAVREQGRWRQVPVAMPCRTGLVLMQLDEQREWKKKDVTTLMNHSEVRLRVSSPLASFDVCWYQGIEGFTGWHSGASVHRPWNNGPDAEVQLSNWSTREEYRRAFRATSTVAAVTNKAADRSKLPNGGYGYLGVCNDSVAQLQAAANEPVTVFPCILGGASKRAMHIMYQELADLTGHANPASCQSISREVCLRIRDGLHSTPCDVIQQPATAEDAARRILACIPERTPYKVLLDCKKDIATLLDTLHTVPRHTGAVDGASTDGASSLHLRSRTVRRGN